MAFRICARAAMRDAIRRANPQILEPIMKVEVETPEEYQGSVIGDLSSRRGVIGGMDSRGNVNVVNATVPDVKADMPRLTCLTNRECHAAIRNMNACWTIHLFFKVMPFEDGCDRQS
jgi:hypothetical protein